MPKSVTRPRYLLLKRAGLRDRKPHTPRHTFASMLIQAGERLAYAKNNWGTRPLPSRWTLTGISFPARIKPLWIAWMMRPDATPGNRWGWDAPRAERLTCVTI
jgi:hypothetical protein